jgi:hypothetical protein
LRLVRFYDTEDWRALTAKRLRDFPFRVRFGYPCKQSASSGLGEYTTAACVGSGTGREGMRHTVIVSIDIYVVIERHGELLLESNHSRILLHHFPHQVMLSYVFQSGEWLCARR